MYVRYDRFISWKEEVEIAYFHNAIVRLGTRSIRHSIAMALWILVTLPTKYLGRDYRDSKRHHRLVVRAQNLLDLALKKASKTAALMVDVKLRVDTIKNLYMHRHIVLRTSTDMMFHDVRVIGYDHLQKVRISIFWSNFAYLADFANFVANY